VRINMTNNSPYTKNLIDVCGLFETPSGAITHNITETKTQKIIAPGTIHLIQAPKSVSSTDSPPISKPGHSVSTSFVISTTKRKRDINSLHSLRHWIVHLLFLKMNHTIHPLLQSFLSSPTTRAALLM
jgi:hypothetical protein